MIKLKYKNVLLMYYYFSFFVGFGLAHKFIGDSCSHVLSNSPGICSLLKTCPFALEDLRKQVLPQTCGFNGTNPIVCCPSPGTVVATTKPVDPEVINRNSVGIGAKSIEKCKEYSKSVYMIIPSPVLSGGVQKNKTINVCAIRSVKLIVGGVKAKPREFPHMAQVGYDGGDGSRQFLCGGSLISERFVLTAGHCLSSKGYGRAKYVRLGDLDISTESDDADVQIIIVEDTIKYPDYQPPSKYHDIGLLKLQKEAKLTPYVRPICLNTHFNMNVEKALASGWGYTEHNENTSDHLLKVTLDLFTHKECTERYDPNKRQLANGILDDTQICAGSKIERKDTCGGDSGGPLQKYHEEVYCAYSLVGVTSFGKACGFVNVPGIYTRVSYYVDWIENIVWP